MDLRGLWNQIQTKAFGRAFFTVQFDLTQACNLRCTHCYQAHHSNLGGLNEKDWLDILSRVTKIGKKWAATPVFLICGGEPTLSKAFLPVLKSMREQWPDASITVLSNGTRFGAADSVHRQPSLRSLLDSLVNLQVSVQVSLEGATSASHNQFRGIDAFERATAGIQRLRSVGVPVILQAVLTKQVATQIPELFDLAASLSADSLNFARFIPEGHGRKLLATHPEQLLLGLELQSAMREILIHSDRTKVPTATDGPLWTLLKSNLGTAERLGFYSIIIDYQGFLKVSSRTPERIGHALKDSIEDVLINHPLLRKLRMGELTGCGACTYFKQNRCSGDRSFAYSTTGSYLGPDLACWKLEENFNVADKRIPHRDQAKNEVEWTSLHHPSGRTYDRPQIQESTHVT
jgi:MoaA/NifB/PqqE/SkfB family radical SAM enzyme